MKISISKATLTAITVRAIPNAIAVANTAREVKAAFPFASVGDVPSNEVIIDSLTNLNFKDVKSLNTKAVQVTLGADDVHLNIDDEYLKASAALVSDFYGAIANPLLGIAKAFIPAIFVAKDFSEKATALETEWNAPVSAEEPSVAVKSKS